MPMSAVNSKAPAPKPFLRKHASSLGETDAFPGARTRGFLAEVAYYDEIHVGYGARFAAAVEETVIGRNPTGSSLWRSLISRGVLVIGARDEETGAEAGRTVRTPVAIPYCSRACHTPSPNVELSAHGVAGAGLWVPTRSRNYRGKASAKVSAQGKYKGCEAGRGLGAGYGAR